MQKIITERVGERVVILLQADVDAADHRLTRRLQNPRQAEQEFSVWIDCSSLECIKSFGICHFINQLLVLKAMGAHILLLQVGEQHRRLLQLLQVDPLFTIAPNLEEAYHLMQAS